MPLGLFAGRSRTPTRKKSPTFEDRDRPRFVGGGGADTLAKGHLHELGLESPESGLFRSTANPLAKVGAESVGAADSPPFERIGDGHTYLCRCQMAKVELHALL